MFVTLRNASNESSGTQRGLYFVMYYLFFFFFPRLFEETDEIRFELHGPLLTEINSGENM